ncbi:hypothetical protein BGZ96_010255 [Linnemannia gamsii]|uniref:Endocytosis protein 3 n=1 Tax=Linnemannia gamsii TaxID=64522 RepID=A0ABQ7JV35_9FUNG|nr:hypothetical protein BGZ96_010255 [Linnemannia gamsii]
MVLDTITLSTREKQVYGHLWVASGAGQCGFITDPDNKGVLGQHGFSIAVRLIAHAQNGENPSPKLISTVAPAPHFEGISSSEISDSSLSLFRSALTSVTSQSTGPEVIISDEDRAKYAAMFLACDPVNGLLDGEEGRKVFEKSQLPLDKLAYIWSLADTQQRGSLDLTDFTVAIHYIRLLMDREITTLPNELPPSLYDSCNRPLLATGATSANKTEIRPEPQLTGTSGRTRSSLQKSFQVTGQKKVDTPTSRQSTGGSSDRDVPWDVSPEEKAKFDRYFDQLDIDHDGFVEGEMAVPFFMESKQPEAVLAQIWDLANITKSGHLSKDEFAVAMHLIYRNNNSSGNVQIPATLPISLIPPSLRATQMPALSMSKLSTPNIDFFSNEERATEFEKSPRIFTPKSLLTRLAMAVKANNGDREFNILDTKLNQETKAVKGIQTERAQLEERIAQSQDMREMMEQRLRNLKAQKERESKAVETMKSSLASMESELSSLRMAIDVSKRELEVAQANKSSFLSALANGQEESLELKVVLQKNCDEVLKLRQDLETRMRMLGLDPLDFPGTQSSEDRNLYKEEAEVHKIIMETFREQE